MSSGLEITSVSWNVGPLLRAVDGASKRATARAGEAVLGAAGRRVPYRTGALAASGGLMGRILAAGSYRGSFQGELNAFAQIAEREARAKPDVRSS